jgi:glycosyltransferase involved in cell wall biosynthesis
MVVVLNDHRVFDALDSLMRQRRRPERILVVDGGSTSEYRERVGRVLAHLPADLIVVPGLPVESREGALDAIHEDVTAFLDADEVAPPEWLGHLIEPIEAGQAEFVGGPTRPVRPPKSSIERYHAEIERKIYEEDLARGIQYLPLGNSAWVSSVLRSLRFDTRWRYAEDLDLESRALRAGARGTYVPEAWVYHNKTTEASYLQLFRKRYRYLVASASVFLRDRRVRSRLAERRRGLRHPLGWVEGVLKPIALVHAYLRLWKSSARSRSRAPSRKP